MKKDARWEIVYLIISLLVTWLIYRDGPPLKVAFWYRVCQVSQYIAYHSGRLGLAAEHTYHLEVERTHT